jgi:hypothetical protein
MAAEACVLEPTRGRRRGSAGWPWGSRPGSPAWMKTWCGHDCVAGMARPRARPSRCRGLSAPTDVAAGELLTRGRRARAPARGWRGGGRRRSRSDPGDSVAPPAARLHGSARHAPPGRAPAPGRVGARRQVAELTRRQGPGQSWRAAGRRGPWAARRHPEGPPPRGAARGAPPEDRAVLKAARLARGMTIPTWVRAGAARGSNRRAAGGTLGQHGTEMAAVGPQLQAWPRAA